MAKTIIELRDVWKTYKMEETEVNALRGVSIAINEDEFVSIQGPSGSGKSTLMHLVGCLDLPTKGKVLLDGHDISKLSESELATIRGKRIGFVFQAFNLIPSLNAIENVSLPMIFNGMPKDKREEVAKDLLIDIGLKDRMYHRPNQMSGGEQQRVAIARALANDPQVILADEPTGDICAVNWRTNECWLLVTAEASKPPPSSVRSAAILNTSPVPIRVAADVPRIGNTDRRFTHCRQGQRFPNSHTLDKEGPTWNLQP